MKEKEEGKEKEKMPGTSALTPPSDIGDEGTKALDGLKDIIGEVIYDVQDPSITITSSTASTTTTSVSTTSSFEKSASSSSSSSTPSLSSSSSSSKDDSSMKEGIIAGHIDGPELISFEKIYGYLVKEQGKSLTTQEVTKLGEQYLTSDRMLKLFSEDPEQAYKELSIAERFDTGMFIKLIIYAQLCSNGKFAFENGKYLMDLVETSSFNLADPMLLAYAVRLSNEDLALYVTKELVRKGAVIADNILFHSYNNPQVTKFLLLEKPSIITCQDKLTGTDMVMKKVQYKFSSASETDKGKLKTNLDLLKAAKMEQEKAAKMEQEFPCFTTEGTRCFVPIDVTNTTEKQEYREHSFFLENPTLKEGVGGLHKANSPVTTPTHTKNYYNWDVIYDPSSKSVRIDLLKDKIVTAPSSGSDSVTTSSLSSTTVSLVTEDISTELSGESTIDAA